jgi:serine/threonine protein kinase
VDRDTFLDVLRQSRLLSDQQLAEVAGEFSGREPSQAIATSLISRGWLTPFQARRLAEGQAAGLILGQYRLLEEAGQGGFGRVYKALHVVMGRTVAVKVISPEVAEEARARSWFKREVQAATQLFHPNIVMAFDANEADGLLFLVMEYIDGSDLETLVRRQGPLPVGVACEMMRQAARALQYAHERGMVHRDVKPANLLVPRAPSTPSAESPSAGPPVAVKIVDFGLARLHRTVGAHSLSSQNEKRFLGTPDYVSPEQVRDASAVDVRSDLYSLGCTFYYALAGRKPFRGETVFETVIKHLEEEAQPLRAIRPEIPPAVAAIVKRLMSKDPAKRFQTPAELIKELDFLCGPSGGIAALEPGGVVQDCGTEAPSEKGEGATRLLPGLAFGGIPAQAPPGSKVVPRIPVPVPAGRDRSEWSALEDDDTWGESLVEKLAAPDRTALCAEGDGPSGLVPAPEVTFEEETLSPSARGEAGKDGEAAAGPAAQECGQGPLAGPSLRSGPLWDLWQQWVGVIEVFARGGGVRQVNEVAYRELHRELLETCRSQAAAGGDAEPLRRLESLVEPWLEPQTFAAADRAALACLLPQCRQIEREVFGDDSVNLKETLGLVNLLTVFLLAAVMGAAGLYWRGGHGGTVPAKLSLAAVRSLFATYPILSLALVTSAVIFLCVTLVSRLRRT